VKVAGLEDGFGVVSQRKREEFCFVHRKLWFIEKTNDLIVIKFRSKRRLEKDYKLSNMANISRSLVECHRALKTIILEAAKKNGGTVPATFEAAEEIVNQAFKVGDFHNAATGDNLKTSLHNFNNTRTGRRIAKKLGHDLFTDEDDVLLSKDKPMLKVTALQQINETDGTPTNDVTLMESIEEVPSDKQLAWQATIEDDTEEYAGFKMLAMPFRCIVRTPFDEAFVGKNELPSKLKFEDLFEVELLDKFGVFMSKNLFEKKRMMLIGNPGDKITLQTWLPVLMEKVQHADPNKPVTFPESRAVWKGELFWALGISDLSLEDEIDSGMDIILEMGEYVAMIMNDVRSKNIDGIESEPEEEVSGMMSSNADEVANLLKGALGKEELDTLVKYLKGDKNVPEETANTIVSSLKDDVKKTAGFPIVWGKILRKFKEYLSPKENMVEDEIKYNTFAQLDPAHRAREVELRKKDPDNFLPASGASNVSTRIRG
jgi:hypothetical protein